MEIFACLFAFSSPFVSVKLLAFSVDNSFESHKWHNTLLSSIPIIQSIWLEIRSFVLMKCTKLFWSCVHCTVLNNLPYYAATFNSTNGKSFCAQVWFRKFGKFNRGKAQNEHSTKKLRIKGINLNKLARLLSFFFELVAVGREACSWAKNGGNVFSKSEMWTADWNIWSTPDWSINWKVHENTTHTQNKRPKTPTKITNCNCFTSTKYWIFQWVECYKNGEKFSNWTKSAVNHVYKSLSSIYDIVATSMVWICYFWGIQTDSANSDEVPWT